jgi:hypothetical protein
MLVPKEEQGCTVIGCRRKHHALLDYAYTGHGALVAASYNDRQARLDC